ncbi:glycosyltransferase family 2 protein [Candidatus Gottesmanbacteria bacterium]|nr:glycosyltransferase family 2 protein [Candidatus Gottesmanbacteria bacterium]
MLFKKRITLVIPCKNEEAALYHLLAKVPSFVDEVLVVDNNSSDNTAQVARNGGAKVFKEKRSVNGIGYGFAHQTGLKNATGDYIVTMDGDNTYPVEAIEEIVTYMEKSNIDFVSCNRLPLTNKSSITLFRRLGIGILNLWIGLLYGYYFIDILTGMWVMRKNIAGKLKLKSGDWNFSPEVKLAALYHKDIRFSEYHIPYYVRINGISKLNVIKTGLSHFFFILERRLKVDNMLPKFPLKSYAYEALGTMKGFIALFLVKGN